MSLTDASTTESCSDAAAWPVEWQTRCDGIVAVAQVDGKSVAGISGPWSDKYALTWWERPLPQRQLELFDSLDEAKREVERWAQRLRERGAKSESSPAATEHCTASPSPLPAPSLFDRLRDAVGCDRHLPAARRPAREIDFRGLHFGAHD